MSRILGSAPKDDTKLDSRWEAQRTGEPMMLQPAALVRDYTAVIVMLSIAGAALVPAAMWYLVARAHGVKGASVGKYWLRIFPILCLLASAAIWFGILQSPAR